MVGVTSSEISNHTVDSIHFQSWLLFSSPWAIHRRAIIARSKLSNGWNKTFPPEEGLILHIKEMWLHRWDHFIRQDSSSIEQFMRNRLLVLVEKPKSSPKCNSKSPRSRLSCEHRVEWLRKYFLHSNHFLDSCRVVEWPNANVFTPLRWPNIHSQLTRGRISTGSGATIDQQRAC